MCPSATVLLFEETFAHVASGRAAKRRRVKPMLADVSRAVFAGQQKSFGAILGAQRHAQLLREAESIEANKVFDDAAVSNTIDIDVACDELPPCCGNTDDRTGVSAVHGRHHRDEVILGEHELNGDLTWRGGYAQ